MARITPPDHLTGVAASVWRTIVEDSDTPNLLNPEELGAYCELVALEREASARVREEGSVVSDEKGRPVPHPAIAVARQAQQDIKGWGDRFR